MKNKHKQFANEWRIIEKLFATFILLLILLFNIQDDTYAMYDQLHASQGNVARLRARLHTLKEKNKELRDNPDLSQYELEMRSRTAIVTAYTSRIEETDDSPCISADNTNICEVDYCVVAHNYLPFDTKINLEGIGECVVKDRMNSRYSHEHMDIYFGNDLEGAKQFGVKELKYTID